MRRTSAVLASLALSAPAVGLTVHGEEAAAADSLGSIPTSRLHDLVGDPDEERAFVTGGDLDAVLELDGSGRVSRTFADLPGATDLALDDAADMLYVVLPRAGEIGVIDLGTGATTRHSLGGICSDFGSSVSGLSLAGGRLWSVSTCGTSPWVAFDPETHEVEVYEHGEGYIEETVAATETPGVLYTASDDGTLKWDVDAGGPPTVAARRGIELRGLTVSPAGHVLGQLHSDGDVLELSGSDLTTRNLFAATTRSPWYGVRGVAVSSTGSMTLAFEDDQYYTSAQTYAPGEAVRSSQVSLPHEYVEPGGVVYGGDRVYVLGHGTHGDPIDVAVLDSPAGAPPHPLGTRRLQVSSIGEIVAVPRVGRAFVTTGRGGNSVLVLDSRGRVERVLDGLPGANNTSLSPSGHELTVLLAHGDAAAVIDTRSLAVRKVRLPDDQWLTGMAVTSGLLWFGAIGDAMGTHALSAETSEMNGPFDPTYVPRGYFASPLHPHRLYGLDVDLPREGTLTSYRTSAEAPVTRDLVARSNGGAGSRELEFTPDGLHLIVPPAATTDHRVFDARTLDYAGRPDAQSGPAAVSVRSDGLVAYGAAHNDLPPYGQGPVEDRKRVDVRRSTWGPHLTWVNTPDRYWNDLVPRGLAFGRRDLYAVFGTSGDYLVRVVGMPALKRITVSSDRQRYAVEDKARIVAHVRSGHDRVRFTKVVGKRRTDLGWRRVNRFGNASVSVSLKRDTRVVGMVRRGKQRWTHLAALPVDRR